MNKANVKLSQKELKVMRNADFLLTKNEIMHKVQQMFGMLCKDYSLLLQANKQLLPEEVLQTTPKIYKGEQYRGLPYTMLDYPRYFSKENIFAIRNFFWWGNFFSITLHLSGEYKKNVSTKFGSTAAFE